MHTTPAPLRTGSLAAIAALIASCSPAEQSADAPAGGERPSVSSQPVELFDGRVIPGMPELLGMRAQYEVRLDWLARKRPLLLAQMREHGIEMWIVVSEEFHPDPVTQYVAPPLRYTRRRDVMVFVDAGEDGLAAYSDYWRPRRTTAASSSRSRRRATPAASRTPVPGWGR